MVAWGRDFLAVFRIRHVECQWRAKFCVLDASRSFCVARVTVYLLLATVLTLEGGKEREGVSEYMCVSGQVAGFEE